jgi:hypothetical protein
MHLRRASQKLLAVIAVCVMSFAALAPALANAFGEAPPLIWVELCSAHGVKRVAVDASGNPVPSNQQALQQAEHCPFCHVEHSPTSLPPLLPFGLHCATERAEFPALFYAAPQLSHAWAPALSRGPPALS